MAAYRNGCRAGKDAIGRGDGMPRAVTTPAWFRRDRLGGIGMVVWRTNRLRSRRLENSHASNLPHQSNRS
jgi:hypothetical protein